MKIIIGGAGAVGTYLARLLSKDHMDCVLIDESAERLGGLDGKFDIMTLQGSPTSIKVLKEAGVERADLFVGVTPDESRNMNACTIAHGLGAKMTVARIDNRNPAVVRRHAPLRDGKRVHRDRECRERHTDHQYGKKNTQRPF